MIIFIHGPDTYGSRQYLEAVIAQFKEKHNQGEPAVSFFDSENHDWDDLARQLTGSDLFIRKRLIVAKDILARKDLSEGLSAFLERTALPDDTTLVVYQSGAVDKRLKLVKKLSEGKGSKEFIPPDAPAVEQFIKERFRSNNKKIEPEAVRELSGIVGADLWRAQAEVDKLSCLPEETITLAAVKQNVAVSLDDEIWPFVDALSTGKKSEALRFLERQLQSGAEPLYLLSMLARQARLLLALQGASGSDAALAAQLGLNPFVVKKSRQQARNFTVARLQLIYRALLRLDSALKSGRGEPAVLFTVLLDTIVR